MSNLSALILSAGKGVRMKSQRPKVLHLIGGVPMVERVCRTLKQLKINKICVVVGLRGDEVKSLLKSQIPQLHYIKQSVLDGSGGAVRQARSWIRSCRGRILVTCGDAPLITTNTYRELFQVHSKDKNVVTVLTSQVAHPRGYGRIVRYRDGRVMKIVEELDASPLEKEIKEINSGTYCFEVKPLLNALGLIHNNNAKKEYYLTDAVGIINQQGGRVGAKKVEDFREALGINSMRELSLAEAFHYQMKNERLMADGIRIMDPLTTYIDEDVQIEPETVVLPQSFILGRCRIGSRCQIGPWVYMKDMIIENDAKIQASFLESSTVKEGATVGPYSRVRPHSVIGRRAYLGNFSEVKNTVLGPGSKANHLSYLGDAKLGKNVNIGAGTITCNYDGFRKNPTLIDDNAFIGSNANLIAPIRIGAHAVVGAGSSLSQNVPAWALALERASFQVKKGWARGQKKKLRKKR